MLVAYCGSSGRQTCVLGGVEELLALLDDSLATLSTIRSSKYATPIKVRLCSVDIVAPFHQNVVKLGQASQFSRYYVDIATPPFDKASQNGSV